MAAQVKFVRVTNTCDRPITVYTRYPKPKKKGSKGSTVHQSSIRLAPGETTSRAIAYSALVGARNWDTLNDRGCISLEFVKWTPPFATVTAQRESVSFDIRVSPKKTRKVTVAEGETSRTIRLSQVVQRKKLQSLAKKRRVKISRTLIGPRYGPARSVGSWGYENVYICDKCGRPIVFRYHPPVPIHI